MTILPLTFLLAAAQGLAPDAGAPQKTVVQRAPAPFAEDLKLDAPPVTKAGVATPVARPTMQSMPGLVKEALYGADPRPVPGVSRPLDRVHVDEPGDGRVWAMGRRYKLSAGAEGVTYVPFFGSEAPQSYPIRFALRSVTLGGTPVELAAAPSPRREAGSVALVHGSALVERWHLGLDTVEQTFVLDVPQGEGELLLDLAVETELSVTDVVEGVDFTCPAPSARGERRVRFGDMTVIDGRGRRYAAPVERSSDGLVLRVPATFLAEATSPLTIDPVVTNFFIDPTRTTVTADPAYDASTDRWLITSQEEFSATDEDVRGDMLDGAGNAIPGAFEYIDFTTESWRTPMCANNNLSDQFLVVASRGAAGSREIWGRTRAAGSNAMSLQFVIANTLTGEKVNPDVGGDPVLVGPTYYCVVWQRQFSATDTDIHYQLVSPNTTLLLPNTGYIDDSGSTLDFSPEVSKANGVSPFDTQRWNVVFSRVFSPVDTDVYGAQVDWDGDVVTASFPIDLAGADDLFPQASSPLDAPHGERDWAVTYERVVGAEKDIMLASLRGATNGTTENLSALEGPSVGQLQEAAHITGDGAQYVVTYDELFGTSQSDHDVYCAVVRHSGGTLDVVVAHENLAFSGASERFPRIVSRRDAGGEPGRFAIAWAQDGGLSGVNDIEGVLFDAPATWASVGSTVCLGLPNSTGEPATFRVLGSDLRADNRLLFDVHGLPSSSFGFFNMGQNPGSVPVGSGTFCIGTPFQRLSGQTLNSLNTRAVSLGLDLNTLPPNAAVQAGATWRFQYWYRDSVNGVVTSNLSNAVAVTFR